MGRPRKNPISQQVPKKIYALEGMTDILTETNAIWDALLKKFSKVSRVYGFTRVETPLLEDIHLYSGIGRGENLAESAVTFEAGNKTAVVRTTILPSVLRAYAQGKIYENIPLSKWFYSGQVVSYKSGAKALGSDFEFGFEVFGNFTHLTEAQVIGAVWDLLGSLGLTDLVLEINNIGKAQCQATYRETLHDFLSGKKYSLCDSCNEHLSGRIINVFRCDNLDCQAVLSEAPTILDFLDADSHKHFTNILEALDELNIPYQLNPLYVGPDGHGRTNVVIKHKQKNGNVVIGEGGYHEDLMESVCGKNHCCFGFRGSLSTIYKLLEAAKIEIAREMRNDVFLVPLGELASKKSLRLFRDLIVEKISVYDHFGTSGVKNQLKAAEAYKAPIALIMGQKEAMDEMVILRDVKSGMQEIISYDKIVDEVKKRLGR